MYTTPFHTLPAIRAAVVSGLGEGDLRWDDVTQDRPQKFLSSLGLANRTLVVPRQIHGPAIHCVADPGNDGSHTGPDRPTADGLITASNSVVLGITVADCVPVFLFDPARRAIGLIHAGREGTLLAIAAAGVQHMGQHFGSDPQDLHALIGPSAGPCCYEVDQQRADAFLALGLPVAGARHLDLWAANRQQLITKGLPQESVHLSGICTICGDAHFSYRNGHGRNRNLAVFALA